MEDQVSNFRDWPEVQGCVVLEGLDSAVVGITVDRPARLIYSTTLIEEILISRDGMTEEAATEFAEFNIYSACFSPRSPVFVSLLDNWD